MSSRKLATSKQKEYVEALCKEFGRDVPDLETLGFSDANDLIQELRGLRTPPPSTEKQRKFIRDLLEHWEGYSLRKPVDELDVKEAVEVLRCLQTGDIAPGGLLIADKPVERGRVIKLFKS